MMLARRLLMGAVKGPATYVNDTFTGADATDLTSHTPDIGSVSWALLSAGDSSIYKIYSNKVRKTESGAYASTYSPIIVDAGQSNCVITCDVLYTSVPVAIVFRGGTGATPAFRFFYLYDAAGYSNKLNFNYWNGSAFVSDEKSAAILSLSNGTYYSCKITLNGSSVTAEVQGQTFAITDSATASNTKHGISRYSSAASECLDNFKITSLS